MRKSNWEQHNAQVSKSNLSASAPLSLAFQNVTGTTSIFYAADLGCGSGVDTIAMLDKGWNVLAIDKDESSMKNLKEKTNHPLLGFNIQTFENISLPYMQMDLINASMALPFCHPLHFYSCWATIHKALKHQGLFCGHFFGLNDSWAGRPSMTFLSRENVLDLLEGFEIIWLDEKEKEGKTISGTIKNWHVFSLLVRKI